MSGEEELAKRLKRWSTERLKDRLKGAYQERRGMNPDNPEIAQLEAVIEIFHAELKRREDENSQA